MVLALAALVVFTGAALQSLTGFGFAVASGPLLVLVLGAHDAVTTVLVLGAVLNLLGLLTAADRAAAAHREAFALLAFALPGLALGALAFTWLDERALALCVCAGVLLAVAARVRRPSGRPPGPLALPLAGLTAGVLTTTTGTNGPPMAVYLLATGAAPARLRATLALVFAGLAVFGIAALSAGGGMALRPLDAALAPAVLAGHALGRRLAERLDGTRAAERIALATLAAAGVAAGLGALT